ncbi:MAG: hydroxymethylglutaryl-CoA lyase [Acidobacteriota bacterium]
MTRGPAVEAAATETGALAAGARHIEIIEVGPRDGFQMEKTFLPTELKVKTIETLARSGLREIEATSFVHPGVVPQMRDAAEVMERIERQPGVSYLALVPNFRGARRAFDAGVDGLRMVTCVTESYNRANVGLSVAESLQRFERVVEASARRGLEVDAVLAASFGCPFEGEVPRKRMVRVAKDFAAAGSRSLGLGDSAGLATPLQVRELVTAIRDALPEMPLWLHLHDTRGLGMANALAAMELGITRFDTSFGGLGGCPVVVGAAGNIATEETVYMCQGMGLETGVDLDVVREASRGVQRFLGRPLPSRVLRAGTLDELVAANASP